MSAPGPVVASVAAVVALSLVASACSVAPRDLLLVVGGTVLDAAVIAALLWGCAALTAAAAVTVAVLGRHPGDRPRAIAASAAVGVLLVAALLGSAVWVGGALVLGAVVAGDPSATTILSPPPGLACGVVVREGGFLRASTGRLYVVSPSGVAIPGATWRANEIRLPVSDGNSSVTWRPRGGTLRLAGAMTDTVDFSCPG